MENASKALLIAGAILLAIVIISLGLVVVNNTKDTINGSNLSQQTIEVFNGKFESYAGIKKGSDVNALMSVVASVNASASRAKKNNDVDNTLFVNVDATKATVVTGVKNVTGDSESAVQYPTFTKTSTYTVTLEMTAGIVSNVIIEDVK